MRVLRGLLLVVMTVGASGIITEAALARRGGDSRPVAALGREAPHPHATACGATPRSSSSASRRWTSKPKRSAADQKLYSKAAANGTAFKSKSTATKDFANKYEKQYTQKPTPGNPAPSKRPDHIPETTSVGGKTYNVTYNVNQGGYGYWSGGPGIGTWMMYDAMSDAVMMSVLMQRHQYSYDEPRFSGGGFAKFMPIIGLLVILVIVLLSYRAFA